MRKRLNALIIVFITVPITFIYAYAEKEAFPINAGATCITSSCHAEMGKKKFVHATGVDTKLCDKCHTLIKEREHGFREIPEDVRPLCAQCHSEALLTPMDITGSPPKVIIEDEDNEIIFHAPFSGGKCTECHDAHESDYYKHLKLQYPESFYATFSVEKYSLCYKCHKEMKEALTEPRTFTATRFRNGNLNLHFRHVNKEKGRTCRACHLHHSSRGPVLIRETFPFGTRTLTIKYEKTDTGGTCGPTCHTKARYDRYEPLYNPIKITPRPGEDATERELELSRERDMQREREKQAGSENNKLPKGDMK